MNTNSIDEDALLEALRVWWNTDATDMDESVMRKAILAYLAAVAKKAKGGEGD